jgi:CrcB protein
MASPPYDEPMDGATSATKLGLVFLGAGAGGVLRYWLGGVVQHWFGASAPGWASFPVGTLVVNVSGCFLIGLLAVMLTGPLMVREEVRLALLIGVLGGYTTFSSFGRETLALVHDGQWLFAGLNVLVSNAAGLAAVFAGDRLAMRLFGGGAP